MTNHNTVAAFETFTAEAALKVAELQRAVALNQRAHNTVVEYISPGFRAAEEVAYDLAVTDGSFSEHRSESLTAAGIHNLAEYAAPFRLAQDVPPPGDIPELGMFTVPLFNIGSTDAPLRCGERGRLVGSIFDSLETSKGANLPVLLDPEEYTPDGYQALEGNDGFAAQVLDGWDMIRKQPGSNSTHQAPVRIIRGMVVVPEALAVPADTDTFLPYGYALLPTLHISKNPYHTITGGTPPVAAVDARLLIRGNVQPAGGIIDFPYRKMRYVHADVSGQEAALKVSAAQEAASGPDQLFKDGRLTARAQGALALYLYPHYVESQPPVIPGITLKGAVGGANLHVGAASHRSTLGIRTLDGIAYPGRDMGVIYSLQVLTARPSEQ